MLTRYPCVHLEKLLRDGGKERPKFESTHRYSSLNIERVVVEDTDDYAKPFRELLQSTGLMPLEKDILVLRYKYNESFSSIAKELRLVGTETAIRLHDESLKKLKSQWGDYETWRRKLFD